MKTVSEIIERVRILHSYGKSRGYDHGFDWALAEIVAQFGSLHIYDPKNQVVVSKKTADECLSHMESLKYGGHPEGVKAYAELRDALEEEK